MLMVVSFGISWPISIYKSWKSRTAKGKSIIFTLFIWAGYIFGTTGKLLSDEITYVLVFYIINLLTVSFDMILYFRNSRLDKLREKQQCNS